jgi:hypothetical protein
MTLLVSILIGMTLQSTPEEQLQKARTSFNDGDLEKSLGTLASIEVDSTSDETWAQAELLRAECQSAMGNAPQVKAALTRALEHNPESTLDARRAPPRLVAQLESLRAELKGELEVRLERPAPGSELRIDGRAVGALPYRGQLSLGKHSVEGRWTDGSVRAVSVMVKPNRIHELVLQPPPVDVPRAAAQPELPANPNLAWGVGATSLGGALLVGGGIWSVFTLNAWNQEQRWASGDYRASEAPTAAQVHSTRTQVSVGRLGSAGCAALGTAAVALGLYWLLAPPQAPAPLPAGATRE